MRVASHLSALWPIPFVVAQVLTTRRKFSMPFSRRIFFQNQPQSAQTRTFHGPREVLEHQKLLFNSRNHQSRVSRLSNHGATRSSRLDSSFLRYWTRTDAEIGSFKASTARVPFQMHAHKMPPSGVEFLSGSKLASSNCKSVEKISS